MRREDKLHTQAMISARKPADRRGLSISIIAFSAREADVPRPPMTYRTGCGADGKRSRGARKPEPRSRELEHQTWRRDVHVHTSAPFLLDEGRNESLSSGDSAGAATRSACRGASRDSRSSYSTRIKRMCVLCVDGESSSIRNLARPFLRSPRRSSPVSF